MSGSYHGYVGTLGIGSLSCVCVCVVIYACKNVHACTVENQRESAGTVHFAFFFFFEKMSLHFFGTH